MVGTAQSALSHSRGLSSITPVSWQGKALVEENGYPEQKKTLSAEQVCLFKVAA